MSDDRPTNPPPRLAPSGSFIRSAAASDALQRAADAVIAHVTSDARTALERAAMEKRDAVCADLLVMREEFYREGVASGKRACAIFMRAFVELVRTGCAIGAIDSRALTARIRANGYAVVHAEVVAVCRDLGIPVADLDQHG